MLSYLLSLICLSILLATTSQIVGTRAYLFGALCTCLYLFSFMICSIHGVKVGLLIMFWMGGLYFEEDGMYVLEYLYCLWFRAGIMIIYI